MIALVVILAAVGLQQSTFGSGYASNGERIYFTAANDSGERITYRGGPVFGGMMMGSQLTCASCHDSDGSGGPHLMHMQLMDAPDIRWAALAGLDTFRGLAVEGVRPTGEILSSDMPRWNLSDENLLDLADFLKSTLDPTKGENSLFSGESMMGGWWVVFPILFLLMMFYFMFSMRNQGGFWSDRGESRRGPSENQDSESAMDILKKRYAKGEISKEEFEEIKQDLR